MRRTARVLVTLTERDDGDLGVSLERVGGTDQGWAVEMVASMISDDQATELDSIELASGVRIQSVRDGG